MPRSCTFRTTKKKAEFLDLLAEIGNVSRAAKACNLPRRTLYSCRAVDRAFASAWDVSLEIGLDALEDEAIRRAREGFEEPVFHGGLRCGSVRKYSDLLLIFLLKSRRPYRDSGAIVRDAQALPPPLIIVPHPARPAKQHPSKTDLQTALSRTERVGCPVP